LTDSRGNGRNGQGEITMNTKLTGIAGAFAAALWLTGAAHGAGMLTSEDGMTLYTFDKDKDGASSCYDDCAVKWPPYMAKADAKLTEGWTMVKRTDGKMQWAYDGKPVYMFQGDKAKGDMAGDGMGGAWHIISE
jgi:predicted lipoprotein with Yx(FWY)xxD motif